MGDGSARPRIHGPIRRGHRVRSLAGHAPRVWTGLGTGDAVGGRHRGGAGSDPEGVPGVMRKQSPRGPRGGRGRSERKAGSGRRRDVRGSGESRGAGGRRSLRRLGHADRSRSDGTAARMRTLHRTRCGPPRGRRGRNIGDQPKLQGTDGKSGRAGLPGEPGGRGRIGRGRLHTRAGGIRGRNPSLSLPADRQRETGSRRRADPARFSGEP